MSAVVIVLHRIGMNSLYMTGGIQLAHDGALDVLQGNLHSSAGRSLIVGGEVHIHRSQFLAPEVSHEGGSSVMYAHVELRRGRCGDDHILWHTREMQGNHQTHIKGFIERLQQPEGI